MTIKQVDDWIRASRADRFISLGRGARYREAITQGFDQAGGGQKDGGVEAEGGVAALAAEEAAGQGLTADKEAWPERERVIQCTSQQQQVRAPGAGGGEGDS